jgi:FtsH ternary system domain X3-analog
MAEMTIRLRVNPETGKKDIVISLSSDDDAMPHEHEQRHRQLVDQLIEGGILGAGDVGNIVIDREAESPLPNTPVSNPSQDQRRAHQEGN